MSDQYEPLYDDDGQHAGWAVEASDGAIVGVSLDGEITGAVDPGTGELIDHSGYELDTGDDPYDQLQQQYAQLEDRVNGWEQQEPAFAYIPPPDDGQEQVESWLEDASDIQHAFGRSLTRREKAELAMHADATGQTLMAAAHDLAERGRSPIVDIDEGSEHARRAARTQLMAEHLEDIHDPADAEGVRQATRSSYDLDNREQRQQYMADKLEQRDLSDAYVFNASTEYATPEEEGWTDGDLD